jgi:hypothetical protein
MIPIVRDSPCFPVSIILSPSAIDEPRGCGSRSQPFVTPLAYDHSTEGGLTVWRLHVHGADVPGRWVIVDREFWPVEEPPEKPGPRW